VLVTDILPPSASRLLRQARATLRLRRRLSPEIPPVESAADQILFWNTYSSVDPAAALSRLPEYGELPPAFQQFFRDG